MMIGDDEGGGNPHAGSSGTATPMEVDSVGGPLSQQSQQQQQQQQQTLLGVEAAKPSRRSHPKSRTGCKTCKARKIKVSERASEWIRVRIHRRRAWCWLYRQGLVLSVHGYRFLATLLPAFTWMPYPSRLLSYVTCRSLGYLRLHSGIQGSDPSCLSFSGNHRPPPLTAYIDDTLCTYMYLVSPN